MPERAALVTALILGRPLCLPCIATNGTMSIQRADTTLEIIQTVLVLHRQTGRCQACGLDTEVLWVSRPS
jgi:hypothetical protein